MVNVRFTGGIQVVVKWCTGGYEVVYRWLTGGVCVVHDLLKMAVVRGIYFFGLIGSYFAL